MLLLLALYLLPTQSAHAQENECVLPLCSSLKVEIVRNDEMTPGCSAGSTSCGDEFRQITYTVYLRRSKTVSQNDPLLPFDLEYNELDVEVSLLDLGQQYSHIDVGATKTCFETGVGIKWDLLDTINGNKAIFSATDRSAGISFGNKGTGGTPCGSQQPNGTSNIITFKYTPTPDHVVGCGGIGPPLTRCAYAELFTIVVNAYPGENIAFQFGTRRYLPSNGGTQCTIEHVTTGTRNGLSTIQAISPGHHTGTPNEAILAQLLAPTQVGPDEKSFPIRILNSGNSSITVSYLEFMVRALTANLDLPFEYEIAVPRVSVSGADPNIRFLHYIIEDVGVTLGPNDSHIVGRVIVKGPSLSNLSGSVTFTFMDSGAHPAKSRIKTSEGCTSLNAFGAINSTFDGDDPCTDPDIRFFVEGEGLTCQASKVRVGIRTANPVANIRLRKIEFDLDFSWAASGIEITGVNFPNWPGIDCAQYGCFTNQNSQKVCWQVTQTGRTFKFCYETPDDPSAPLFSLNDSRYMEILFDTPGNACIEGAKFRLLRIVYAGGTPACVPVIDPEVGFPLCGDPATMLIGTIETETFEGVEEVTVNLSRANVDPDAGMIGCAGVSCSPSECQPGPKLTNATGVYGFSCTDCTTCNFVKVIPEKDDNPLNGVTTYDLVLISQHILSIEPFDSPYKMIAADANKSGSITSFDIVELRKLILGIYTELPNNTSWRFVDKSFSFPNPNNPFQTAFPEGINCLTFPSSGHDFVGVKVGDVNNTAMGNRPGERPVVGLDWPNFLAKSEDVLTVPIRYTGTEPLEAIQLGLRFDPSKLHLIGPSIGDVESYLPGNFNLLQAGVGEIRTLWLPMTDDVALIRPGSVLFNLSFKVLDDLPSGALPLWLDHQLLDCAAWKPGGVEYLVTETPVAKRDEPAISAIGLTASVVPNPTLGGVTLTVRATKADKGRVTLFDAFGQSLLKRECELHEGKQDIPLPEVASLPAGVYIWKVYTPSLEAQGQLIKQ